MKNRIGEAASGAASLGCILAILAFNPVVGGLCFDYALETIAGIDVPWYADALVGLFLAQPLIAIAFVTWIVALCGVPVPFIQ